MALSSSSRTLLLLACIACRSYCCTAAELRGEAPNPTRFYLTFYSFMFGACLCSTYCDGRAVPPTGLGRKLSFWGNLALSGSGCDASSQGSAICGTATSTGVVEDTSSRSSAGSYAWTPSTGSRANSYGIAYGDNTYTNTQTYSGASDYGSEASSSSISVSSSGDDDDNDDDDDDDN